MKLKRITILSTLIMVLFGLAFAEESLSATISGEQLTIKWSAEGECTLTVYRNWWPISVSYVDGAAGGTAMTVPAEGKYTVRLKTAESCMKVDVKKEQTSVENQKPTKVPEGIQTVDPTAAPIPLPTLVQTQRPTMKPTEVPSAVPTGNSGQSMTSMAAEVIRQVNEERAKYGLSPLSVSAQLSSAACIRANEIVEKFSHTRPDGSSWSTVSSAASGENIAKGHSSADRVMAAWMSSEGHRANILRESFGSIGVCALKVNGVIYWVQLFGR